jgi:hypothetical protein
LREGRRRRGGCEFGDWPSSSWVKAGTRELGRMAWPGLACLGA